MDQNRRHSCSDSDSSNDSDSSHEEVLIESAIVHSNINNQSVIMNQSRLSYKRDLGEDVSVLHNPDSQYNREQWIKVFYNGRLKRLYEPPKDLALLIKHMRDRFKDLDYDIQRCIPQSDEKEFIKNLTKNFTISYEDSDEDEIDISEN